MNTLGDRQHLRASLIAWRWTALAVVACSGLLAWFARVGADYDWLVAMGDHIRDTGRVPDYVPYAAAPSAGWRDVPVLAQLVTSLADAWGDDFVVFAHVALVASSLVVVACTSRLDGASDRAVALSTTAVFVGALSAFVLVRLQTFSLLPFVLLVAVVASEHRRLTMRIWWAPVLVAIWGNLHGAVLLGVCVLGAYLVFGRLRHRPFETIAVGMLSLLALLLTPQGWHTPSYYLTVLDNEAAARGEGLWGQPDLGAPLDAVLVIAVALLVLGLLRRRQPVWVYVAVLGLGAATTIASRNGVWLLLLLGAVAPAGRVSLNPIASHRRAALVSVVVAAAVVTSLLSVRKTPTYAADPALVRAVEGVAGSGVVLAPSPLAESLAVAGVTVWLTNPIDAFDKQDQGAYLDFLAGGAGMQRAVVEADVVVTEDGTAAAERMADLDGFHRSECATGWTCHVRR